MGVTYTTAVVRDAQRDRSIRRHPGTLDAALVCASLLAIALMWSAYAGRVAVTPAGDAAPFDLNQAADAGALEPVLAPLFESPTDTRLAARELSGYLRQADGARRLLTNVGALAHARIAATGIDAAHGALVYRTRLAEERSRAAAAKRPPPDTIALLTGSQIADLKPRVVVREQSVVRRALWLWGAVYLAGFHLVSLLWRRRGVPGDRVLLLLAHVLTGIGLAVMISRPDPLRDTILFVRYAQSVGIGLAFAAAASLVNVRTADLRHFSFVPLLGAFLLSALLIVFGGGPGGSNAKVNLGPVQPIEAIRLLLALFLAGYFARHWEILRAVREKSVGGVELPGWLDVPRIRYVAPVVVGVGAALALFFFQKDLGPALMLSVVFLAAYGVARGRAGMVLAGAALLCAGFYLGYRLQISATLADRVRMWQSPWDNAARGGDQIAHALWAMATGGPSGAGLGLGDTRYLPAGHTDLVLAAIAEDLGLGGVLAVAALFAAMLWRGFSTAIRASTDYGFFLAAILALSIAVPVLLMAAGTLGLVPLTGVVTPFLSFGGSAMLGNFTALGLLAAIRSDRAPASDLAAFRPAVRWLGAGLGAAAVMLVAAAVRVQALRADEIAIRPHLGIQADGSRRYQYNPRVIDAARQIPRGSVLDRAGLPLASDDRAVLGRAAGAYERLGVSLDSACPDRGARCYPLGGRAFHLLGDVTSRTNWSATNTSFVERDSEARLRGFDDHQGGVRVAGVDGGESWTIRRDYRDLVPILRHRHDPNHPAMRALIARPRDVTLTIDARLQLRVASILSRYAGRSSTGHAAAVVLDPATGDLLASVSYPWPAGPTPGQVGSLEASEALLDRARYGLYAPGSTFKLVTAAAALLRDPAAARTTFVCSRLDDGRVGARVQGWTRPIRDDVLDRNPHGTVDMHKGMVVSCNAYFAQLAASLGAAPMIAAAERAGVPLARGNSVTRIRETLPQAGYGQGDVVASPLRMARIAAAIASDGTMCDVRADTGLPAAGQHEFVPAATARLLGSFMRDVVLAGTARSLRGEPIAIAGKTGTAEVADAPSHAWFIGYAPYGPATSRIAVAVILENAGYGGAAAAPLAGEIVSAASALGLIR
jgi:cell division protein FtsW (lipid II flippase)